MGWNPFKAIKKFVKKAIDVVVDVFEAVVDIVASPFGMAGFGSGELSADQTQQEILGPLLNKDSGVGDIPIIYGKRRVGGNRVFVSTNGTNNEYLYVAIVLSEGQIDGFETLYVDDVAVPLSSYAHGVSATPSSGDFSGRVTCQFFDGRDDQSASSLLSEAPNWGSNHKLSGLAYLALKFRWKKIESQADSDNNPFRSGIPKVNAIVRGRKIFDVIDSYTTSYQGSISAVSGSGTKTNSATTASITQVTSPPTANYSNTITFATTESGATFKSRADAIVQSRSRSLNTGSGGTNTTKTFTSVLTINNEYQAVQIRQILTNTDTSTVVSDITDGPIASTQGTQVTAMINEDYACPTGNYTLETQIVLTGNGPQTGIPNGTYNVSGEIGVSVGVSATHTTAYASETVVFDNNPVNVLLDYMRNPRYGKGLTNDVFEWASIRMAAAQCDQTVPYTSSTTGPFNEFDGILSSGSTLLNNIRTILASFRGIMPYQSGKYYLRIPHGGDDSDVDSAPTPPPVTFIITDDIMVGGLQIQGESKDRKVNQIRITYTDPDADYQPNDVIWPPEDSQVYADYLTEDNMELHTQLTLGHCTHRERALNYAETMVKTSRNKMIVSLSTTLAAAQVSVGDLIRIVNRLMSFDGIYRVDSVGLTSEGSINFQCTEHNSSDYELDGQAADIVRPSISLPNPLLVSAPTSVTVTSSGISSTSGYVAQSQMKVTWTASTDPFVNEYITQYKLASDSTYITAGITNDTQFFIGPVSTGEQYDVRVTARNELDRRSNYASAATHTVS